MAAPRLLYQSAFTQPSSSRDTYIYSIVPCLTSNLALITSSDELLILDRHTLRNQGGSLPNVPDGVTCLTGVDEAGNAVAVAGRDGSVGVWDLRSGSRAWSVQTEEKRPVTALDCLKGGFDVAIGTELAVQQAVIAVWDVRNGGKPRWQAVESHNDDITDLRFHPSFGGRKLLSGSTDGLVSVFDTTVMDEEDALLQVVNHGSIHRAGFLAEEAVYALSHDEQFSIHPLNTEDEEATEPSPIVFGDVREKLDCEYVVDVLRSSEGNILATGRHSGEPRVDLIPIASTPSWSLQDQRRVSLIGGHGEEIVRTVYVDDVAQAIYTGGEDGQVKIWKLSG